MTLFPAARWRGPVPNQGGSMGQILGLVLHIQEGSEAGSDAWFHNPASKVSAHFGNPKTGPLDQWVEVGRVAWAEVNGNTNWISLENEGHSGDQLTASQLENAAQLLAWLHQGYGVPLRISDSTVPGLTGHGLGGAAWGGHTDCPGGPILAQRQQIINRAAAIGGTPSTPGGTAMPNIPPSIAQKWPELAGDFPPNGSYSNDGAIIWGDAGARAAAMYARQALDAVNALAARSVAPVSVDVAAIASAVVAAIVPHLTDAVNPDAIAAAVVTAVETHAPGTVDTGALAAEVVSHIAAALGNG